MRKDFTPVHSTLSGSSNAATELYPSDALVTDILKFAASYRVEKLTSEQFVAYCLN